MGQFYLTINTGEIRVDTPIPVRKGGVHCELALSFCLYKNSTYSSKDQYKKLHSKSVISDRAIFPVSVELNQIHPVRQNRNGAKIKSTPTYTILKYYDISAATHTSPIDHTIKEPYTTNNIYQKKVFLHSFQTDNHRKRHSHSPTHPHSRYRPRSHFGNLRQFGITFCTTQ